MPSSALVLIAPGFEEVEATAPIDLLRRAGAFVTLASCSDSITVTGRSSITLTADCLLANIQDPFAFNLLILPGGPAVFELRKQNEILNLIRKFAEAGKTIGAICAAPLLLLDAGILSYKHACTAHGSTVNEIPHISENQSVVKEGQLITSRGAGTAVDFSLALIEHLFDSEKMEEVRVSIHADLPAFLD